MTKKDTNCCKGIAIILVYVHHLFYQVLDINQLPIKYSVLISDNDVLNIYGFLAKVCVAIFVFLSGYGTARSYIDKNLENADYREIVRYTIKRYINLLLSFQIIFIIFFIPAIVNGEVSEIYGGVDSVSILYLLLDFFGVANIAGTPTYNGTWWYMSFALMLIITLPGIIQFCKKYGFLALVIEFLLIRYLNTDFTFSWYMFPAFLGVLFAQKRIYERLVTFFDAASILKKSCVVAVVLYGIGVCLELKLYTSAELWDVLEAVIAALVCALVCTLIGRIPLIRDALCFIGKHSMNMFLTHSFIYYYWFRAHTYSFRYPALIVFVLLVETLLISVVLEGLKKIIRFDRLTALICEKVTGIVLVK